MKEKTATQIEFDEMVKELYQILKPLGFKKKALHFYRVVEQSLQMISIQKGAYGSADEIYFTANIKKAPYKEPISFYPDDNTQRIGDIKGNGDIWYEFSGTIVDIFKQKQKFSLKNLLQGYVGIFLKAPEQAYHHQFWLLHEFKKTAFKNDDSPWKYYTVAFLEYEIREFFDENNLLYKKYKSFLYHLLMVCYLQFSQNISMKENKWEEYSKKIMDSVYKNKSIFARAIQIFEYTKMIWITSGKSIDGIKDVKEFKELLIKYAEKYSLSRLEQQNIGVVSFVGKDKNAKDYGFIHSDGNREKIFFHHSNNTHLIFDTIDQESVTYEVEEYIRYGYPARRAVNVFVSPCTNKDNYNI